MVTDPCSLTALTADSKCFNCLNAHEKQALLVWFLAQGLQAAGGLDLTDPNALINYVACFTCEPSFVLDSFNVAVAQNLAAAGGARVDLSIADLRAAIKCLVCTDDKTLQAAETVLRCKLNTYFSGIVIL